jgi:hypothetical protein
MKNFIAGVLLTLLAVFAMGATQSERGLTFNGHPVHRLDQGPGIHFLPCTPVDSGPVDKDCVAIALLQ